MVPTRSLVFLLLFGVALEVPAQFLEQEVLALHQPWEIEAYWKQIETVDQHHRGRHTVDSLDNNNFKKVILMIQHHGYPKGSMVPNLVFTHQRSAYVLEHYFPIFLQAWEENKADTFWFMHNVRGLHRSRYARDFTQPDAWTYTEVLDRLTPWLAKKLDYDLTPFDSLFNNYMSDVRRIISNPPLHQWTTPENDRISWYKVDGVLYTHEMCRDSSYSMPQPIMFDAGTGTYKFLLDVPETYLRIDKDGALIVHSNGRDQKPLAPTDNRAVR